MKTSLFQFLLTASFLLLFSTLVSAQTADGKEETESEYELGHVKKRSEKAHKDSDETNKKNQKAMDKANKVAEKNRKEKLSGKKKKEDAHEFKF